MVSREGKVITAKANRKGLELLGESTLNEVVHNTPAFSPRGIFFRTFSSLIHIPTKS
jgi:hypothetical protein